MHLSHTEKDRSSLSISIYKKVYDEERKEFTY